MAKHIDLFVIDGDFVFTNGLITTVSDRASIAQDVKHTIIETGLLLLLIRERDPLTRAQIINTIILKIEDDERLRPGTVQFINGDTLGEYYVTAKTMEFEVLDISLSVATGEPEPTVIDDLPLRQYQDFVDRATDSLNEYL